MPARDLLVSPQHRILARSIIAERMFGSVEVLIAATKLAELDGVEQVYSPNGTHYIHILFDHHEIIDVDGALVESLLVAEQSSSLIDGQDHKAAPRDVKPFVADISGQFDLRRAG